MKNNNKKAKRKWVLKNPNYQKEWRIKNLDKVKAQQKIYRLKNKKQIALRNSIWQKEYESKNPHKKQRRYFLTKVANIGVVLSFEEYKNMTINQNGLCAICGNTDNGRELSIDHCHKTNKVRGLLCKKCNSAIGFLSDDIGLLEKAIMYLKKYQ